MKNNLSSCLLFIVLLFGTNSAAQVQQVKFTQVTGTNGTSIGKINSIVKDKYGFLWLSDQDKRCIIRYDGTHMTRYENDPKNPNSLGGYYPECLAADSAGNIWIGFYGMGLDKFNPATNTFTHYRHKQDDATSLSDDVVAALCVDHLGNVWVGDYGALDLLDQQTGEFKHYRHDARDPTSLSYNKIRAIYEDREGELWVGTGFPFEESNEGGLNLFHRKTGTFTRYLSNPKDPTSLINNKVRAILEDSKGTFWVGTADDGLHTMDRKTGKFTRLTYNPANPEQLSRPAVKTYDDHITFITEDAAAQIWIGTLSNGIVRYDPVTKQLTHYGNEADGSGEYKENNSWWAYATADGLIWLSTQAARLYKIDLFNSQIPQFNSNSNDVYFSLAEETDSVVWFGTNNGLIRKDFSNGTSTRFVHEEQNPNSLSNNRIFAMLRDKQGGFWVATRNGLNAFDPKTKTFTRYLYNPPAGKVDNMIRVVSLSQDKDLNIWAGTGGNGLYKLDFKTRKLSNYRANLADTNSLSSDVAYCLLDDGSTDIWMGSGLNGGVNRMNRQSGKVKRYLPGLVISTMYRDGEGVIWVGAPEGSLFRYDRASDNFYSFREENTGIDIFGIYAICEDNEKNLWATTVNGIYRLNQKRNHAIVYGKENGLRNAVELSSIDKRRNGDLYLFGNTKGYYAFNPSKLAIPNSATILYFTNVWLNDEALTPTKEGPLKEPIFSAKELQLRYTQNVFSIQFAAIDFRNAMPTRIYYKLENYDKDWHPAAGDNSVQYFKVPPGRYTFRIKTANSSDGEWIEKSITIIISPPWWSTWWAYAIYALLSIAMAVSVYRYQKERLVKAERERARVKELEHAREIENAYNKLRNTQAQLVQAEKMASLGELTAGIAHEIQNPLNFVNNFSETNKELLQELEQASEKGDQTEIKALLSDLQANEEKISHHGKRADSIVKGMLQHARASTGKKEPTDINKLVDEHLRLSYQGMRAKDKELNTTIETHFDEAIGNVSVVAQDISRVLLNLFNNAFYALQQKKELSDGTFEPVISVRTKREVGCVSITVKDNGTGMSAKVAEKVFQPFFTTKPTGEGTGLGLSLSYDIITKGHGGTLIVHSVEGEGSEFVVALPV